MLIKLRLVTVFNVYQNDYKEFCKLHFLFTSKSQTQNVRSCCDRSGILCFAQIQQQKIALQKYS